MPGPQLFQVPIGIVDPPTKNPRFVPEELEELVASIKKVGIIEPLIGVGVPPDRVRLVAGLRRFTSGKLAGLKTVPMLVYPRLSERDELTISTVENLHRKDLTTIERGEAFIKLMKTGMSEKQAAEALGVSDYTVSISVQIVRNCLPEIKEACHRKEITQQEALDFSRYPAAIQRSLFTKTLAKKINKSIDEPRTRSRNGKSEAESFLRGAIKALSNSNYYAAIDLTKKATKSIEQVAGLK